MAKKYKKIWNSREERDAWEAQRHQENRLNHWPEPKTVVIDRDRAGRSRNRRNACGREGDQSAVQQAFAEFLVLVRVPEPTQAPFRRRQDKPRAAAERENHRHSKRRDEKYEHDNHVNGQGRTSPRPGKLGGGVRVVHRVLVQGASRRMMAFEASTRPATAAISKMDIAAARGQLKLVIASS